MVTKFRHLPTDVENPMTDFSVSSLGSSIGAIVEGIDLSHPLSDNCYADLLRAIAEHKVLVFRVVALSVSEFHTFA